MARRRRRRSDNEALVVLAGVVVGLALLSYIASNPYLLTLLLVAGAAFVYAHWVRPRQLDRRAARDAVALAETERQELRERSLNLGGLLTLTASEFEHRIGEILAEFGFEDVQHVGRAGDGGFDLFATDGEGRRVGVQCKRYAPDKLIRTPDVRLLHGDATRARVRGLFVTTSGYTADARSFADMNGVELIDGARLAQMIAAAGLH